MRNGCVFMFQVAEASGSQLAKWVITVFLHSNPVKQSYQDND